MNRFRFAAILALTACAALPATAQTIPAGDDPWVTPNNGQTNFQFPVGDVESLCSVAASTTWNRRVALKGVPVTGTDYDTVVRRLKPATFNSSGSASTTAQVVHMAFVSTGPQSTPCGRLNWKVGLAGPQATTAMNIIRTSSKGGVFYADIAVNVEFKASDAGSGAYVGSLFYNILLPNPTNGTPWSFGTTGNFRPGISETEDCIAVLRKKLLTYDPNSSHYYFISDMIAQGRCTKQT